jgi:hypothetical protein
MKIRYAIILTLALLGTVGFGPFEFFSSIFTPMPTLNISSSGWISQEARTITSQASNLSPNVLKLSLEAYMHARQRGMDPKQMLTIIDYSKPSTERRLWVVDVRTGKVLFNTWVTHGKNSGEMMATSFSNEPGSLKSSIGVFETDEPYTGHNGYSLKLSGLERGINDNAYRRDIVVHGAWYANPDIIKQYGQIGRSWGCPAVSPKTAGPLINTIKDRTLVVVYYPDRNWLNHSTFLAG